jgi:hypothetical protein
MKAQDNISQRDLQYQYNGEKSIRLSQEVIPAKAKSTSGIVKKSIRQSQEVHPARSRSLAGKKQRIDLQTQEVISVKARYLQRGEIRSRALSRYYMLLLLFTSIYLFRSADVKASSHIRKGEVSAKLRYLQS